MKLTPIAIVTCLLGIPALSSAQCVPATSTIQSMTLTATPQTENRSGLAFNPLLGLYYSVNAGSAGYPIDTYDEAGTLVSTVTSGFDYRGAWWDPIGQRLLGNGYNNLGIFEQDLDPVTGFPLGAGTVVLASSQPDAQSIGDLDPDASEIIYFFNGSIHRFDAATHAALGTTAITGLPVSLASINSNTVMYIGCIGYEYGLYDYANRRVLYVNKATGAYSGSTQLPANAPARSSFGLSYANGKVWLFEQGAWLGYDLGFSVGIGDAATQGSLQLWPNPAAGSIAIAADDGRPIAAVRITDLAGRVVLNAASARSSGPCSLDVSALPNGNYLVHATVTRADRVLPLVILR
ncbi:MAG: T9SS type A sorting domain-containing protein [Flavobacteriales bacterium]|nr:T9SS type A sorting domain-containing protein [Flavobacteriales bacterium]